MLRGKLALEKSITSELRIKGTSKVQILYKAYFKIFLIFQRESDLLTIR